MQQAVWPSLYIMPLLSRKLPGCVYGLHRQAAAGHGSGGEDDRGGGLALATATSLFPSIATQLHGLMARGSYAYIDRGSPLPLGIMLSGDYATEALKMVQMDSYKSPVVTVFPTKGVVVIAGKLDKKKRDCAFFLDRTDMLVLLNCCYRMVREEPEDRSVIITNQSMAELTKAAAATFFDIELAKPLETQKSEGLPERNWEEKRKTYVKCVDRWAVSPNEDEDKPNKLCILDLEAVSYKIITSKGLEVTFKGPEQLPFEKFQLVVSEGPSFNGPPKNLICRLPGTGYFKAAFDRIERERKGLVASPERRHVKPRLPPIPYKPGASVFTFPKGATDSSLPRLEAEQISPPKPRRPVRPVRKVVAEVAGVVAVAGPQKKGRKYDRKWTLEQLDKLSSQAKLVDPIRIRPDVNPTVNDLPLQTEGETVEETLPSNDENAVPDALKTPLSYAQDDIKTSAVKSVEALEESEASAVPPGVPPLQRRRFQPSQPGPVDLGYDVQQHGGASVFTFPNGDVEASPLCLEAEQILPPKSPRPLRPVQNVVKTREDIDDGIRRIKLAETAEVVAVAGPQNKGLKIDRTEPIKEVACLSSLANADSRRKLPARRRRVKPYVRPSQTEGETAGETLPPKDENADPDAPNTHLFDAQNDTKPRAVQPVEAQDAIKPIVAQPAGEGRKGTKAAVMDFFGKFRRHQVRPPYEQFSDKV